MPHLSYWMQIQRTHPLAVVVKFATVGLAAFKNVASGFPGGAVVGNPPANAGDMGSCPSPGRSHMPWSG